MLQLGNGNAEICVIGRCHFNSSIGQITYGLCEMLSRYYPVAVCPTDRSFRKLDRIELPNGRRIPVRRDVDKMKVTIFADVLWNGRKDRNYWLVPGVGLRICYLVFDSDTLPQEWVDIIDRHFDMVMVPAPHMLQMLENSQVTKPAMVMPVPLDFYGLLEKPMKRVTLGPVKFGCISAFHPRKGHLELIEAFGHAFGNNDNACLHIHSNLSFGGYHHELRKFSHANGLRNVHITTDPMEEWQKADFINNLDVYTHFSTGESYSIGLREALALGKPAVVSDVGGHKDFHGTPGVFYVPADQKRAARYPEIDNRQFGWQYGVNPLNGAKALLAAFDAVADGDLDSTMDTRRVHASAYSMSRLGVSFERLFNPHSTKFRLPDPFQAEFAVPPDVRKTISERLASTGTPFSHIRNRVVPLHDGGFFSIFNTFMTHLVWDLQEPRCQRVLPDWNAGRLVQKLGGIGPTSFCYGRPEDGNIWLKLFEPLFGLSDAQMNDDHFVYQHASLPEHHFNEIREPNLTYIHAYKLYKTANFRMWRQQYHRVLQHHVRLRPHIQQVVDDFARENLRAPFMIAAHVRHPSHVMEQPDKKMALTQDYIDNIYEILDRHNISHSSNEWGVFLATDQMGVVKQFQEEFGNRLSYYPQFSRTTDKNDEAYQALSEEEKAKEGHQLQHMLAAGQNWSTKYAEEIIIDAYTLARCHALLHVVSNVSTAVSYINPDIEMVFCSPRSQVNAKAA